MENITVSKAGLFWQKIGKCQILVTFFALIAFFVTLKLTSNREMAAGLAGLFLFIAGFFLFILSVPKSHGVTSHTVTVTLIATFFALLASLAAAFSTVSEDFTGDLVFLAVGIALLIVFVCLTYGGVKKIGSSRESRNIIWFSCAVEFMVILLLMLLV